MNDEYVAQQLEYAEHAVDAGFLDRARENVRNVEDALRAEAAAVRALIDARRADANPRPHDQGSTESVDPEPEEPLLPPVSHPRLGAPIAVYEYLNEAGLMLYVVARFEPKKFAQARPDDAGWTWSLGDTPRVLYRLPRVLEHVAQNRREPLYVVEGERDVEAIEKAGGVSTCNPGGALKWRPEFSETLQGCRRVVVVADRDDTGIKHARAVAESLGRVGVVAELVQAAEGKDVADHLAAGHTLDELEPLPDIATAATDHPASSSHGEPPKLTATPMASIKMRSIDWFEKPLWQKSAFELLAAPKGAGKGTYIAGLATRITHAHENALFISSEDSAEIDLKPRLVAAGADIERCFLIQQHIRLPEHVLDLHELATDLGGVGLLVIDPLANHIGDSNSNNYAEVRDAIAPLNNLAHQLHCLLIGVRHPGKDRSRGAVASILGSTAWVDTPRAVVMIAVDDQQPDLRHIQVVAGNRSLNGSAQQFRIEAVDVPGLTRADHARCRTRRISKVRRRAARTPQGPRHEIRESARPDPRHPRRRRRTRIRHPRRARRPRVRPLRTHRPATYGWDSHGKD